MEKNKNLRHNSRFLLNKAIVRAAIPLVLFLFPGIVIAASQTYYVTFTGSGSKNGLSYSNSWSWNDFLNSGNWSATEKSSNLDPGDIVYLSGTFNVGTSTSNIPGSGASGNYIVIDGNDGVNAPAVFKPSAVSGSNKTININGHDYLEFRNIEFDGQTWAFINNSGDSSHIKIHDCILTLNNGTYAITVERADNWEIYNNTISKKNNSGGDGIRILANNPVHDISIYNNTLSDWRHDAIGVNGNSSHDMYNISIFNNHFDLPLQGYGRAFSCSTVFGKSGRTYNIRIYNNYITNMRAPSQIAHSDHVYVYYNLFYNARNCCENAGDAGCTIAYSNCSTKSYFKTGQHIVIHTAQGSVDHIYIYNNTFYDSAEAAILLADQAATIDNLYIKNNIFYNAAHSASPTDDPAGSTCSSIDRTISTYGSKGITNVEFENNMIYQTEHSTDIQWKGGYYTLSAFETKFPWASGNFASDPFPNQKGGINFTLPADSPAIDAGKNIGNNYAHGWNPDTLLPPNTLETLNQNEFGIGWDLGAYIFAPPSKPKAQLNPPANFGKKKEEG